MDVETKATGAEPVEEKLPEKSEYETPQLVVFELQDHTASGGPEIKERDGGDGLFS